MTGTDAFYSNIKPFKSRLLGFFEQAHYHVVPEDWQIVISDVRNSTVAIEQGRYKDVNLIGVSAITAVVNAIERREMPFVFGGDGATMLVPSSLKGKVSEALLAVRKLSRDRFGLELRAAIVPLELLTRAGHSLRVAKHAVSDDVTLALFSGSALTQAEALVKGPEAARFELIGEPGAEADLTGLECRWKPIQNRNGEILSVLIRACSSDSAQAMRVYKELLEEIELIGGGSSESIHPVRSERLKLNLNPFSLKGGEIQAKSGSLLSLYLGVLMGWFLFAFRMKAFGTDWGKYKEDVSRNSDFWKYDEVLRFVIDVTPAQKRALLACFESRLARGEIHYGAHASEQALLTCMVMDRRGNHVHFVDGGSGGYAMAAKQLKAQLKSKAPS
jgi:hypothetical protein